MTATIRHKLLVKQSISERVDILYKIEKGKKWSKITYKKSPCSPWQRRRKIKTV